MRPSTVSVSGLRAYLIAPSAALRLFSEKFALLILLVAGSLTGSLPCNQRAKVKQKDRDALNLRSLQLSSRCLPVVQPWPCGHHPQTAWFCCRKAFAAYILRRPGTKSLIYLRCAGHLLLQNKPLQILVAQNNDNICSARESTL